MSLFAYRHSFFCLKQFSHLGVAPSHGTPLFLQRRHALVKYNWFAIAALEIALLVLARPRVKKDCIVYNTAERVVLIVVLTQVVLAVGKSYLAAVVCPDIG